ncbi:YjjG family noncanonical pyrimidine nucleotidase [Bacteroidota bacterium]
MNYKWLLFDLDGTLFNYDKAESTALEKAFNEFNHNFEPAYNDAYIEINKFLWTDFEQGKITTQKLRVKRFEILFSNLNINYEPKMFSDCYLEALSGESHLIEGAEVVLNSLFEKAGLVLITNGIKEVQRLRLKNSIISQYFSSIIISEEVGAAKPSKLIFDAAFERMNHPPKIDVLIIGDSLSSDIKGGNDYGIDTCWFNPKQKPYEFDIRANYEIVKLYEVLMIA